jgi:asparagine synthase (glutamine-hydrolysing)
VCGIGGFVAAPPRDEAAGVDRVEALLSALSHRGPDGRAWIRSGRAVLGATRLAIRSPNDGEQPVVDVESGVIAVCNGEIDNHRALRSWLAARGRSVVSAVDVAVLPALYLELGPDFVSRLEGPFAMALWDPQTERLVLARDRAGEKSLFFSVRPGGVRFASEIAALVRDDPALLVPDETALAAYLDRGFFEAPRTPLVDVRKLAPGELVTVDAGGISRRRYWRLDLPATPKRTRGLDAFDRVIHEAVERQTDVDVEFGILLSGGLDSALLAAVARRVRPMRRMSAFTVRFDESSYDEGGAAERVARTLGLESVVTRLQADEVPELLRDLVAHAGEPLADPAWLPLAVLARRAARDVRMVLSGEGADELFGGYPTYMGPRLAEGWLRLPKPLRAILHRAADALPSSDRKVTLGFLLKRFLRAAELGGLERHRAWLASIPSDVLLRLEAKTLRSYLPEPSSAELLDVLQQHDFETALAEALLTKADRGGMRWGLELRAPFLAPGVVAFAATLPPEQRVRGVSTKVFLKQYALRYLPRNIVYRRKRGLSVPLTGWLRGPLRSWAAETLGSDRLQVVGIRRKDALALLDEHAAGRIDHARALWTLVVLAEWLAWVERTRGA